MSTLSRLFFIVSIVLKVCCIFGEGIQLSNAFSMEENINLSEIYGLKNTTKIIIKQSIRIKKDPKRVIIENTGTISAIINNLRDVKLSSLCDCLPSHIIVFFKGNNEIFQIGYMNYGKARDHKYLRYKNEEQYIPNDEFFDIIEEILKKSDLCSNYNADFQRYNKKLKEKK